MKKKSSLIIIILFCLILLNLPEKYTEKIRHSGIKFLRAPLAFFTNLSFFFLHPVDYRSIVQENRLLNEENIKLRLENSQLNYFRQENQQLRSILGLKQQLPFSTLTAEVIGFDYSENRRILFVTSGGREGMRKDMVCLNHQGLVGKVIEVGDNFSKVMCINDPNSRVPGKIEDTQEGGLVYGPLKGKYLRMKFLPQESKTHPGARVFTSGWGSIYPKGIIIGIIREIVNEGFYKTALIKPAVDFSKLETVICIK
ncbi:MAG: rod shape-determining protein MreC [Candidatus Omnitrophica bacterium]|nr:rod shape-determining protein MreC [Candidatus Omnitrophota bacterium]MCM8793710.1 rod shape-determining protein MreC [Candidatus Omnitrophota bacterium]